MGEIGVLVGDSSAGTDKFHQCGNSIKLGTQMYLATKKAVV